MIKEALNNYLKKINCNHLNFAILEETFNYTEARKLLN